MVKLTRLKSISTATLMTVILFGFALLGAAPVLAVNVGLEATAGAAGYQTTKAPRAVINQMVASIISQVLGYVGVLFLLLTIIAGFMLMTAGGNEEKVGKAKKLLTGAVIGTIIVFGAYALTSWLVSTVYVGTN